ncbi:hypothetical protein OW763_01500 [Clostridium aestuarii]|uniref:Lipoprotein n=1 Tax=Clostridium aestuarii TaxID=338193 RepID=A0ABT4CW43_9CLOT|nr:hypothetical protein [Clostridium aestuarii]MCY6483027.1 hypothetical protein [Clostridium aestuarii]
MKRKLIIAICGLLATTSFIGCNKKTPVNNTATSGQAVSDSSKTSLKSKEEQKEILNNFDKLTKENSNEQDIINYVDHNIEGLSKENASILMLGLETFKNGHLTQVYDNWAKNNIDEKIRKEFQYDFTIDKIKDIKDKELKQYLESFVNKGYSILMTEGMYSPMQDYKFFNKYSKYLTDDIKNYIDILSTEYDSPAILDANLNISWDELYKRAENCELFLNTYKDSKARVTIDNLYNSYISAYLLGITYDPQSNKLFDEVKESYLKAAESNSDTKISNIVKEYLKILEKNNYKITEESNKFIENAINDLKK